MIRQSSTIDVHRTLSLVAARVAIGLAVGVMASAAPGGENPKFVPVGTITMFGGTVAPAGYFLCDGSELSRTEHEALFEVIGTSFGAGDGISTFNLPDLRQRFPLGLASSGTGSALGESGGDIDHRHDVGATTSSDGDHAHGVSGTTDAAGDHGHAVTGTTASGGNHQHAVSGTTNGGGAHDHLMLRRVDNPAPGAGGWVDAGDGQRFMFTGSQFSACVIDPSFPNPDRAATSLPTSTGPSFRTGAASNHSHGFNASSSTSGDHAHSLTGAAAAAGVHAHGLSTTSDTAGLHSHSLSVESSTSNPPYLALNYIIRE